MENNETKRGMDSNETKRDAAQVDLTEGQSGVGDVEAAGETTAIAAITGPTDTSPVGADTMVKVAGAQQTAESDEEKSE
jgi:hypothetical protein